MTEVFGPVADIYDEVRPGYPDEVTGLIRAYHGGRPAGVVEIGAGTGKGTAVLVRLGAPVTCVEPDARMAAVLRARFPQVRVEREAFERWRPPAGGVPLLAFAMSWHLVDAGTRNRAAYDALAAGGTLTVFGHRYAVADPALAGDIRAALRANGPPPSDRPEHWARDDIAAAGLLTDVRAEQVRREIELAGADYLNLVRTFSWFRRRSVADRAATLRAVTAVLRDAGDRVALDLRTSVVLARRTSQVRVAT